MKIKGKYIILFAALLVISALIYVNNYVTNLKPLKGNFTIWASKENFQYLNDAAKEFMDTNKKVVITVKEKSENEILDFVQSNSTVSESPSIVTVNSSGLRNLNDTGKTKINTADVIINEYGKTFNSWRLKEVTINNDVLAVPLENNPVFMFLRKDILDEYGFKAENIRTWKELLDTSRYIKSKSQGTISLFSYNDVTLESLKKIMLYQGAKAEKVNEIINTIKNDGLMGKRTSLVHIATKDNYKNIIEKYEAGSLTSAMLPAFEVGGNRAVSLDGENVSIIKTTSTADELAVRFITFSINNQTLMEKYLKESDFFPSSTVFYKNSVIDTNFSKVNNEKIWSLMVNVCNRNNVIDDYKKLEENLK